MPLSWCVFFICLSPGRLIKKVGRDVTDGHFVYIYSAIFRHQTDHFIVRRISGR